MSEFRLETWEEAALVSPDAVLHVEETELLCLACAPIRRNRWAVFGREKQGHRTGNWIVLDCDSGAPRTWSPKAPTSRLTQLNAQWQNLEGGRLFAWPEERFVLRSNGEGAWLDAHYRVDVRFHLSFDPEVWNDAPRLWERVQCELADFGSDLNFAARWRTKDVDRWTLLLGSEEKHRVLLQVLEAVLWEVGDQVNWVKCNWRISHRSPSGAYVNALSGGTMRYNYRLEQLLLPWSQFFAFGFLPEHTKETRQAHGCLDLFYNSPESFIEVGLNGPPTQHERLEARLRLRQWLEHNAPEQLDLLLGS